MPQVQLALRNVFVYDGTNNAIVGGCKQFGTTSISEFFFCLRIFIVTPLDFQLYHQQVDGYVTSNDQGTIQPGNYFIASINQPISFLTVTLTNDEARPRNVSGVSPSSLSTSNFRDRVRQRDCACKVTGLDTSMFQYVGLNACHIIPRSHARLFFPNNLQQYLIDQNENQGPSGIDSVQNGVLLSTALHPFWDCHAFSIHPGTMLVRWFMEGMYQTMYDQRPIQFNATLDLPAPPPQILIEHFRQAVLANMKGAGKVQIYDIDPSEDAQTMSIFEQGEGKDYLELFLEDKLLGSTRHSDTNNTRS